MLVLSASSAAPAPSTCVRTSPGAAYYNSSRFLTFEAPRHSPVYHLKLADGRFTGDYPDALSWNGTRVKEVGAVGEGTSPRPLLPSAQLVRIRPQQQTRPHALLPPIHLLRALRVHQCTWTPAALLRRRCMSSSTGPSDRTRLAAP